MGPATKTRRYRTVFIWSVIALLVAVAMAGRMRRLSEPFFRDAGLYIYMGKVVADGGSLYHDIYETKYPGVALMTASLWRVFGNWWPGYVVTQMLIVTGASWMLAWAVAQSAGRHRFRPTLLALIVFLNFTWLVSSGFQLESIQAAFAMLAAVGAISALRTNDLRNAWLIGLAAGCAAMIKPTGLAVAGAFFMTLVLCRRDMGIGRWLAYGAVIGFAALIPNLGVLLYTWHAGLMPEMAGLTHQIKLYGSETPADASLIIKGLHTVIFLLFPMAVRMVLSRREAIESSAESEPANPQTRGLLTFAICWLVLELVGVLLQWRVYSYHLLVAAPAGAVLFGLLPRRDRLVPTVAALAPIAIFSCIASVPDLLRIRQGLQPLPESQYVAAHSTSGDALYSHDMFRMLLETDLKPGSRFGHTFYFVNHDEAPLLFGRGIIEDLRTRRPRYVRLSNQVDSALAEYAHEPFLATRPVRAHNFYLVWDELKQYIYTHYEPVAEFKGHVIWERKPAAITPTNRPVEQPAVVSAGVS